jgi:hypothetical protein
VKRHFIFIAEVQLILSKDNANRAQCKIKTGKSSRTPLHMLRKACPLYGHSHRHEQADGFKQTANGKPKGRLLRAKMPPFTRQKTMFCNALHFKRLHG